MIYRSVKHDWRNEGSLKVLYEHFALDEHNEVSDNDLLYHTTGPLQGIAVLRAGQPDEARVRLDGIAASKLIYKSSAGSRGASGRGRRLALALLNPTFRPTGLNDTIQKKCVEAAQRGVRSMGSNIVGAPPVASLIVDAYK